MIMPDVAFRQRLTSLGHWICWWLRDQGFSNPAVANARGLDMEARLKKAGRLEGLPLMHSEGVELVATQW